MAALVWPQPILPHFGITTPWLITDYTQPVQLQKVARSIKFWMKKEEGLYYPCSENKGMDQLRGYAKLVCTFVFAYTKYWFSHDTAHIMLI